MFYCDFFTKNISVYSYTYEPIAFKLGMVMDTTELLHFFSISMNNLDVHSVLQESWNLSNDSVIKWHDITQSFELINFVR